MDEYLDKPTFICGHRKGGTTMLLALLDNHPELLVYPPDSGFFYAYHPRYNTDEFTDRERVDRLAGFIVDQLEWEFDNVISPEDREALDFPLDDFRRDVAETAEKSDKSPSAMLKSLISAYRRHFDGSPNPVRWVEKTTSTEIYAAEVIDWFPQARFVHVIRDPRDNWASLKSGWSARYERFNDELGRLMQSMIDRGRLGMEFAACNERRFGPSVYKVVKFEDLLREPEQRMREICDFLEVSYNDSLMTPTVCGKLWPGNNFDGLRFDKPSAVNVGRWRERITEEEACLLEHHFGDLMEHFDYPFAFSESERLDAATNHYKWFNFAQLFSIATTSDSEEE